MPLARPFSSSRTRDATVLYITSTRPVRTASASVTLGSYLAWIGQIGMQLVLPAQTRRFCYGCELRAAGVLETAQSRSSRPTPSIFRFGMAASTDMSTFDSGIFGIG